MGQATHRLHGPPPRLAGQGEAGRESLKGSRAIQAGVDGRRDGSRAWGVAKKSSEVPHDARPSPSARRFTKEAIMSPQSRDLLLCGLLAILMMVQLALKKRKLEFRRLRRPICPSCGCQIRRDGGCACTRNAMRKD